jgi:hypothetical protein
MPRRDLTCPCTLTPSEVRPHFVQNHSLVPGFHLRFSCFISHPLNRAIFRCMFDEASSLPWTGLSVISTPGMARMGADLFRSPFAVAYWLIAENVTQSGHSGAA